jgi:CHAT domain-containing protein
MTTTNYQTDDQKGRDIFKTFCEQQPQFTFYKESKKQFAKWDVSYKIKNKSFIGEIKVRDYNSFDFNEWYIQGDKLEALQDLQKQHPTTRVTYINIFKDNITMIWDVTDLDLINTPFSMQKLQKNDYTTEEVLKKVYHLHHKDAEKFETDEAKSIFKPIEELKAKYQMEEDDDKLPF